jgi:hypothetical protein
MTGDDQEPTGDGAADAVDTAERFVLGDGTAVAPPETWGVDIETLCPTDIAVTGRDAIADRGIERPQSPPAPSLDGEWVARPTGSEAETVAERERRATEADRLETAHPSGGGVDSPFARPVTAAAADIDRLPRMSPKQASAAHTDGQRPEQEREQERDQEQEQTQKQEQEHDRPDDHARTAGGDQA